MRAQRHLLLFLLHAVVLVLGLHDEEHSYDFWDASSHNVTLPSHFRIDESISKLIIAANNSICHLSLDLQELNDVLNVSADFATNFDCRFNQGRDEDCFNFHHVLVIPDTRGSITSDGVEYNLNTTVLVCGSNALVPTCHYRLRSNLREISSFSGARFCPYGISNGVTSLWTSTGRLISGTPLDAQPMSYGITASDSPYGGTPLVGTADNDVWFNKSPFFVSMYEIDDYIYTFFREEAIEISQAEDKVLYSRVSRICKNDMGATPIGTELPAGVNLFTTFLKARMSCSTGAETTIPYHFNNLQDTFYLESGSYDGGANQQHLYAVFTSPDNSPLGSVVCVYTFGTHGNDLENVFKGTYLRRSGSSFVSDPNFTPFSCADNRSVDHAERYQLMEPTATQSNGDRPLLQMSGYAFRRVIVDTVQALNGVTYEVMFITAQQEDSSDVVVLKSTYVGSRTDEDKFHVSQLVDLKPTSVRESAPTVTQMRLYGTGSDAYVYVGTTEGIYRVSVSRCEQYTDCCSCTAARDPYCAFDLGTGHCVAVDNDNRMSADLVQDVVAGNTSLCARASGGPSTPNAVGDTEEQATCAGNTGTPVSTETVSTETDGVPTPGPSQSTGLTPTPPIVGGVEPQTGGSSSLTWTIVGAVAGFVGGMVLGIILMAMYKYRTNFWWWNKIASRQSAGAAEKGVSGRKVSGGASNYSKEDEYKKNNLEHAVQNSYSTPPCGSPARLQFSTSNPITTFSETPQLAPRPVLPPVPPGYKPRSGSLLTTASQSSVASSNPPPPLMTYNPKSVATSPYRSAASPSHRPVPINPNLKSDRRTQEHLSNSTREAYGHNIVARTPSIDASKSPRSPNGSIPVSFHAHMHSDPVVEIHDAITGCSSC